MNASPEIIIARTDARFARRVAGIAFAMALTFLPGCGGDFDPASRVTDLRVLAVRADSPYAAPGESVHLEALAVDPAARAITWGWGLCVNPASPSAPGCLAALDFSTVVIEKGRSTFDFALPSDVITSLPAAAAGHAAVGTVVVACPGELAPRVGSIPFACVDAEGRTLTSDEYVVGVKRIFARLSDKNDNPVIADVTWDGEAWLPSEIKDVAFCDESGNDYGACTPSTQHRVAVAVPVSSSESGVDSLGAPFREQIIVQYYATEGMFEHDVRLASDTTTGWTARRESAGRSVTMWFVVRDDRGGVAWDQRQIRVADR
ncbi:MAG TPA: hypothetical protein VK550_21770 [Polyangiaceae bacterium]|nr:hypothetical protein [Polyangiaceae bacterium]